MPAMVFDATDYYTWDVHLVNVLVLPARRRLPNSMNLNYIASYVQLQDAK